MKIDFHSYMFDGYSSEEVVMAHKMLADHHFQYTAPQNLIHAKVDFLHQPNEGERP